MQALPCVLIPGFVLCHTMGRLLRFAGVCENVEVDAGGLVTVRPIFVVDAASHALMLGQLFLIKTRFRQIFENDNVFGTICTESGSVSVISCTLVMSKAGYKDRSGFLPTLN